MEIFSCRVTLWLQFRPQSFHGVCARRFHRVLQLHIEKHLSSVILTAKLTVYIS